MRIVRYDLLHPKALHKALAEHFGPDQKIPQERQVRRWVSGDTKIPGWARIVIDEIVQAPEHEETAPPEDWVERLLTGVFALEQKNEISEDELARAQARVVAHLAVARQRRLRRSGDGGQQSADA